MIQVLRFGEHFPQAVVPASLVTLFMGSLVICISSRLKCLLKSSAPFSLNCFFIIKL